MAASKNLLTLSICALCLSLHVTAYTQRAALVAPRPALATRAAPAMSAAPNAGRRAQLGALGAGMAVLGNVAAASAAEPRSTPWAYSTFLEAVETDQIEKVSFSADGKQVLSIDKDGNRHESLILPEQSQDLIKALVKHNVVFAVQPPPQPSTIGAVGGVLANLAFPLLIIGGLALLQRRGGGMGGPGGMNPMDLGKSKSKIEMEPNTGVGFEDVAGCEASKQVRPAQFGILPRISAAQFRALL